MKSSTAVLSTLAAAVVVASAVAGMVMKPSKAVASTPAIRADSPDVVCAGGIVHYKWYNSRGLQAVTVAVTPEGKPQTCVGSN